MSSTFFVQLSCDCDCAHLVTHGCWVNFPDRPTQGTAIGLRKDASARGWQVLRKGVAGRDICPPCRIVEIKSAAGIDDPEGAA